MSIQKGHLYLEGYTYINCSDNNSDTVGDIRFRVDSISDNLLIEECTTADTEKGGGVWSIYNPKLISKEYITGSIPVWKDNYLYKSPIALESETSSNYIDYVLSEGGVINDYSILYDIYGDSTTSRVVVNSGLRVTDIPNSVGNFLTNVNGVISQRTPSEVLSDLEVLTEVNWGDILGTLSEQTDLQAELDKFVTLATGQTVTGVKIFKNTSGFYLQQASASNPATLRIGPPRDAVDASHAHVLRPAESLSASRTWDLPDKSGTIALTDDIPTAIDGREVEFQVSATHIQWRYVGESVWIDLIALSELEGPAGADGNDGITPHIGANGNWYIGLTDTGVQAEGQDGADGDDGVGIASITLISTVGLVKTYRITFTNATTFDYVVTDGSDGEDGRPGTPGADGDDGREIELRTSLTHIQWRYVGDATWINLIALSALKGDQGAPGADGDDGREIEIAIVEDPFAGGDYIKWRYVGTSSWTTLISVAAITGPAGAPGADGADGAPGEDGADGTSTYYTTHTLALSGIVPENTYFPGFTIDRILVSGSYVENQRIIRVAGRTLSGSVGIKVYRKLHGQTTGAQILPSIGVYTIQNTGNTFDVNYSLSHNNYIYFFIPLGYVNLGEDLSVTITIEHTLTSGGGGLETT